MAILQRIVRTGALLLFCGLLFFVTGFDSLRRLIAEEPAATEPAASVPINSGPTQGILLLRTGKTISGRIIKDGDDYRVEKPNGNMFVPGSIVRLQCESMQDAYRKLRDSANEQGSAGGHVTLARWCLVNQMLSEARRELKDALSLEPTRDDARDLLRKIDEVLEPKTPEVHRIEQDEHARAARAVGLDDAESLGGLSQELGQQFTRRIQPILMNNCALAGCHTTEAPNGFPLLRTSVTSTNRSAVERNLAEVLKQIDLSQPKNSALLTVPRGKHDKRGKPVFNGPKGDEQLETLRAWVATLAKEDAARQKRTARRLPARAKVQNALVESSAATPAKDPFKDVDAEAATIRQVRAESPAPPKSDWKKRPRAPISADAGVEGDPFDPAVFNRQAPKPIRGQ